MTELPTADPMVGAANARKQRSAPGNPPGEPSDAPSVLEIAESRERFAAPATTSEIADWVNEGGAGGEVRR
jgi:hypothetical protein